MSLPLVGMREPYWLVTMKVPKLGWICPQLVHEHQADKGKADNREHGFPDSSSEVRQSFLHAVNSNPDEDKP